MEKISKDIGNIIGYHRPRARIERGWETVFLSSSFLKGAQA
jgi:hypothetical protein